MSHHLDARGLLCPMPILKAKRALRALEPGEMLSITATDPAAPKDFEAFCAATGDALVESTVVEDEFRFIIRRGG